MVDRPCGRGRGRRRLDRFPRESQDIFARTTAVGETRTAKVYSFLLSVRNPSDSDNAIAQIEMRLRYLIDGATSITVKLPSVRMSDPPNSERARFATPSRVAAHDTVSGWCDFIVKADILSGRVIDGYQVVLTDSHQAEATVDALVVSEKRRVV
jgi:hypothetical protein